MRRPSWEVIQALGPEVIDKWLDTDPPVEVKRAGVWVGDECLTDRTSGRDYGLPQFLPMLRGHRIYPVIVG